MEIRSTLRARMMAALCLAGLLLATRAAAAPHPFSPYQPDGATLHLWHFDEKEVPFMDWGSNRKPLWGLLLGASASKPSLEGFGTAVGFAWSKDNEPGTTLPYGPILLAKPELDAGPGDNVTPPFQVMGGDGAFTMEAIVKLDMLPSASPGLAADIITLDDDAQENRVFLFRIEKPGFLSFVPIFGDAVRGGGLASIPKTGPHAINTTDWFHVAVTYDGNENSANNLKFYWTRLGAAGEVANPIGTGTLSADLRREMGDFAIGNSGKVNQKGPFEFFPGDIDEVRISSVARQPYDFFFVDPEVKKRAEDLASRQPPVTPEPKLTIQQVLVDGERAPAFQGSSPLTLPPGNHLLDFDFGFPAGVLTDPLAVKCRLDGLDEDWHPTARGMTLTWEMLDESGALLARSAFSATRSSAEWGSDLLDSPLLARKEPLFVPEKTRKIRVIMSSGTPDTTGAWVIDDLTLTRPNTPGANLWANGHFDDGERLDQIGGVPSGWARHGTEPAIARIILLSSPALGLLDAEQSSSANWTCTQDLSVRPIRGGETFLLGWSEAFNVIAGSSLRATYTNVSSGTYTFRAISATGGPQPGATQLAFPVVIREPYWKQAWFVPSLAVAGVLLVGWGLSLNYRRRARNRFAAIRMANAVERDRARIARDMHDDLGTRVSLLKHAASVVRSAIDKDPGGASHQAARLESAASDLVWAMDGLVWAVNPANDTLDHLAGHLSGIAQDILRDAPVRLRISIPTDFPPLQLGSDFRHHFSLVVKEALHNILKHAGPCEVSLSLSMEDRTLVAVIHDTGEGFDPANPDAGNGLSNLAARAAEMSGTCALESAPGKGTRIVLRCPLPKGPLLKSS
ncbi:MAG: histidine kinase [Luteolibacter sp.]|uniref:LamG-like jellyroll fold domain-containing protein n=1 Tax=Luteolibacter sp. TaxID=1962973 RepID=UPI003266A1DE